MGLGLLAGCGDKDSGADLFGNDDGRTSATATAGTTGTGDGGGSDGSATPTGTSGSTDDGTSEGDDGGDTGADSATTGGLRLDVFSDSTGADDSGGSQGCEKADFLFIVDNSGSMSEEQANLVASFPGFINTIQTTLMAQDYHLMVLDTDALAFGASSISITNGQVTCEVAPSCCIGVCNGLSSISISPPPTECNGQPCANFPLPPPSCDTELGAGKTRSPEDIDCGFTGSGRFMTDQEPDLGAAFSCAALVGAGGDGNEQPMQAMVDALGSQLAPGECNEGFLRNDAILVVTFITDEEDSGSMGDPASWKQALVNAKGGDEDAVVVLGILGDRGVTGGVCTSGDDAPRLRQFAESFTQGQWESVCAPDYTQFFTDAVSVIDFACDNFTPAG